MTVLYQQAYDDVLDYTIDWIDWLVQDTISTSVWEVESGITSANATNSTYSTAIWLSEGVIGTTYTIRNTIETDGGRTKSQCFDVKILASCET